jgi:putative transposase
VYNQALALRKASYEAGAGWISGATLSKRLVTEAKTNPETAFLAEVSAVVLQQALRDSDSAYKNFFDSATGRRKGSRIGEVAVRWSRSLPTEASSGRVIRDASGRFFASFVVVTDSAEDLDRFPDVDSETGIDLGLTHFAVLADGKKIDAPKFPRRAEKKLKRLRQDLARKEKGSNNRRKAVLKVARAQTERWAPTSQVCSECGAKDGPKPPHVREWICSGCGSVHDRDVNAARDILHLGRQMVAAGRAETQNACRAQVGPGLVSAQRSEAGTRRSELTGATR